MTPTGLIPKLRNLLQDNLKVQDPIDLTFYTSRIFSLPDKNIDETTLVVEKNGTEWSNDNYTYDGKLRINETTGEELVSGDVIRVSYSCYEKYSNSELEGYIKSALYYLSVFNYETFSLGTGDVLDPEPIEQQENAIVITAVIIAKGNIRSYKTPEITVTFADNLSIEDKIKKIIDECSESFGNIDYVDLNYSAAEDD